MKKYLIKTGEEQLNIFCHHIEINEDGHLELFIDTVLEACFTEWDYFHRVLHDNDKPNSEDILRYYQGFSYLPPKAREEGAIAKIVDALKELHDAVNAE